MPLFQRQWFYSPCLFRQMAVFCNPYQHNNISECHLKGCNKKSRYGKALQRPEDIRISGGQHKKRQYGSHGYHPQQKNIYTLKPFRCYIQTITVPSEYPQNRSAVAYKIESTGQNKKKGEYCNRHSPSNQNRQGYPRSSC